MNLWFVLQLVLNFVLFSGVVFCLIKIQRDREEDIRINQGLRLLQSKIAVLEDLSDHTESQSRQIMSLMDKKLNEVRGVLQHVNQHIVDVDKAVEKSQKMAEKITKEIPHQEIVEQKITNKYVKAAKLAHQGMAVVDIVKHLGLPRNEVELIAKVNRKKCVFENEVLDFEDTPEDDDFQSIRIGA